MNIAKQEERFGFELSEYQKDILTTMIDAPFNYRWILKKGRQIGMTTCFAVFADYILSEGNNTFIFITGTRKMGQLFLDRYLLNIADVSLIKKRNIPRCSVELKNGSVFQGFSVNQLDALRGLSANGLVIGVDCENLSNNRRAELDLALAGFSCPIIRTWMIGK